MQKRFLLQQVSCWLLLFFITGLSQAQNTSGWYKVYTGKIGNYTATLHLHKSGSNYNGYLWFTQNQWPMPIYYNANSGNNDSLVLSANNGPIGVVLSGIMTDKGYTGVSELSKPDNTPKQAGFYLRVAQDNTLTSFGYYYTGGLAKLSPQLNNRSTASYTASSIWPESNIRNATLYKAVIRQDFGIKAPVTNFTKTLTDEKDKFLLAWKKNNSKLTPKDAAEMGMSLSIQNEAREMVMYESEHFITLAHYIYKYSGGAHGNYSTTLASFNKLKGKRLKLADILTPAGIQYLPTILDQVARLQYSITNTTPLNQNGFLENKIEPNENFYITETGIGFLYPPYALKPFADGEVNLLVPFVAIKQYLQPDYIPKEPKSTP